MEYLDENYNLVHHKTDIEVPEGAEIATISKEKRIEFWKDEGVTWWCSEDKEWETLGTLQSHIDNCGYAVVWQRTTSVDVVDNINHPNHYASGAVECIEAIEASMSAEAFKGFLKGNVQKYMWRYEQKGGAESLEKAQWYLNMLLSRVRS